MSASKNTSSTPPLQPLSARILPPILAVAGIILFLLPITDANFWTLDYILFLAFILTMPVLIIQGRTWAIRGVVVLAVLAFVLSKYVLYPPEESYSPGVLDVIFLALGTFIAVFPYNIRRVRSLLILFALAYFGFLQASCPRIPGALELILLHMFDDNPILMHIIKVGTAVGMGIVFGRYYCGWICPKGIIQEYIYRPTVKLTVPPRLDRALKYGKYVMLGALILFPLVFETQLFRYIGPFRVIFNLDGEYYAVAFLVVVLLTSVFIERAYCRYFCPEGGLLALAQLVSPYRMRLDRTKCTSCRRCYRICPVDAFVVEGKTPVRISRTECIACKECEAVCRDGSLTFGFKLNPQNQEPEGARSEDDNDEGRVSP